MLGLDLVSNFQAFELGILLDVSGAVAPSRQRPVTRTFSVRLLAGTDAGEDLSLQLASRVATSIPVSCPNGDEINTSHSMPNVG